MAIYTLQPSPWYWAFSGPSEELGVGNTPPVPPIGFGFILYETGEFVRDQYGILVVTPLIPPSGYIFLKYSDGQFVLDENGNLVLTPI